MTFRSFAVPVAAVALAAGLWGCAFKSAPTEPTGQDSLAAGNAAFDQKDYAKACELLGRAGGGAETQSRAGLACARSGEAKAKQAFKAALAADPKYPAALEGLGMTAYAEGDLGTAREMLEAGARAGGKDPQAALVLGQTYLLAGQCEPAMAAFQEALNRNPSLLAARARLDATRLLCAARGGRAAVGAPAAAPSHQGNSSVAAPSGSAGGGLSGSVPATGGKEAPKGKPASKTIDLNDI